MKPIFISCLILLGACSALTPSAGNKAALNNERSNSMNTIIFGRIVDKNPKSIKQKLQVTYTLNKEKNGGVFGGDTAFMNVDSDSNYFWVSVPNTELQYFGIRSIRFQIDGVETEAVIRDDLYHKPLFGLDLEKSKEARYIYIGDITIRSGVRKATGLNLDLFDIKEAYNKPNLNSAKSYIQDKGFDTKNFVAKPLSLKRL